MAAVTAGQPSAVLEQIAQQVFGYDSLRPSQHEVLNAVLSGKDTLAVMPTGSGKSAIYQIAALRLPGVTVVISPLIALQQDQVESIQAQGTVQAAVLNSTLSAGARRDVFEQLESQTLEFLFLAPEQFSNEETLNRIKAAKPSLFVVDEAHCVSEWGHDFRPDYLQLGGVIEALGHPVTLALTATASPLVRKEITERLGMNHPEEIVRGFDRPNIQLRVHSFYEEKIKREQLLKAVKAAPKPGIVYVATRKTAEEIAAALADSDFVAAAYHAGMRSSSADKSIPSRDAIQSQFMSGEIDVIVATTAFGMGIDKSDVRFVYHYHIPGSIDAYYQEIGRAGRDSKPASAELFYLSDDLKLQRFFGGGGKVDEEILSEMTEFLDATTQPPSEEQIKEHFGLSQAKVSAALDALETAGLIERGSDGEICEVAEADLVSVVAQAMTAQQRRKQFDHSRIEMMRGYAETNDCRRGYVLSYFGETLADECSGCDRCKTTKDKTTETITYLQPFPIGSTIIHTNFGKGQVLRYEADTVSVLFETVGYKSFITEMIEHSVTCLA